MPRLLPYVKISLQAPSVAIENQTQGAALLRRVHFDAAMAPAVSRECYLAFDVHTKLFVVSRKTVADIDNVAGDGAGRGVGDETRFELGMRAVTLQYQ